MLNNILKPLWLYYSILLIPLWGEAQNKDIGGGNIAELTMRNQHFIEAELTSNFEVELVEYDPVLTSTYKNQINVNYLHIEHDRHLYSSSIASLEYIRKEGRNTFVGRINSTIRHEDLGIQAEADWYHIFKKSNYFLLNMALADRFFPKVKAGVSYYQPLKKAWTIEAGSRYFYDRFDDRHQFFGVVGVEKEISNFWLNGKLTVETEKEFRKHLLLQGRMFMQNEKDYVTLLMTWGNMPEVNDLNYLADHHYSIENWMLGGGYNVYLNERMPLKLMMNWYRYQVNEDIHSNQFHAFFSLGYLF